MEERGLNEFIEAFDTVMLAYIGIVSGTFNIIAKHGNVNSREIASILDYPDELVEAYCKAATAYGLIDRVEGGFQLSKFTLKERISTNPSIIWRGHRGYLLSLFPKILQGRRVDIDPYIRQLESKGCSGLASSYALLVLKQICPIIVRKCDILDLGAGGGTYLIHLLKLHPESSGIGVEADDILAEGIENQLLTHGLTDRARIIRSDIRSFRCHRKFDLILLNNILHYLNRKERSDLIERAFNWLRGAGYLAILEQPMPENSGELKKYKRRIVLNLEFMAIHGTSLPTLTEITTKLSWCGFENPQIHSVDPAGTSMYIVVKKPEENKK